MYQFSDMAKLIFQDPVTLVGTILSNQLEKEQVTYLLNSSSQMPYVFVDASLTNLVTLRLTFVL